MVIISPRRLGKTGLIYHCFDKPEVHEQVTTLFIDILRTTSLQEFTYLLGRVVFKTLGSRSQQMMKGYKMKLFLLDLSFIGWILLCLVTFCIGFLWVKPYIETAHAKFYEELKSRQNL